MIKMGFTFPQYQTHVTSVGHNHNRESCAMCSKVDAYRRERDEFRAKALRRTLEITGRMMPMCNND